MKMSKNHYAPKKIMQKRYHETCLTLPPWIISLEECNGHEFTHFIIFIDQCIVIS